MDGLIDLVVNNLLFHRRSTHFLSKLNSLLIDFQDRFADAEAIPPIDKQQDYELTGSEESGGKTVLKFKRKIDTCDPRDYKLEVEAAVLL